MTKYCNYGSYISATPPTMKIIALCDFAVNMVVMPGDTSGYTGILQVRCGLGWGKPYHSTERTGRT